MWPEIIRVAIIPFGYERWRIMGYMKDVFEGSRVARRIGESSKAVLESCILFVRFNQLLPFASQRPGPHPRSFHRTSIPATASLFTSVLTYR